ncbi:DnaT-like ssDNA-binding protein [Candidatus Contendibacter odensensis]|uniref:Putative DnaT-like domain-containing protein n=1 Tax=Candidatus Contendobacter odensis Run_B_J11 TaxID=1400861 RepID=A0A7U7J2U1_9GAMM|nr:DnaT-like ssDNA-binding protein [Candidatus Contendobacter odensis]CDH43842.1 conserved hypothetical protein [Candidatus Contendobacter odensis Run_B_J11]
MSLNVESGTGSSSANALADVVTADAYHADRGHTAWAATTTAQRESALIRASDYLCDEGRFPWIGSKAQGYAQAMPWPRSNATEADGSAIPATVVPYRVIRACCELAGKALDAELLPDLDRGGRIASESIGALSVSYFQDAASGAVIQAVAGLLAPLLRRRLTPAAPGWIGAGDASYGAGFSIGMHDHPGSNNS